MQEKLNIERRMEDQVISFKTAVLAKEKGYPQDDYPCFGDDGNIHTIAYFNTSYPIANSYFQSTQASLQRWLREVHDIRVLIDFETIDDSETAYTFKIVRDIPEGKGRKKDTWDFYETTYSFNQGGGWYKTYEEALELGLIEGLKLIK